MAGLLSGFVDRFLHRRSLRRWSVMGEQADSVDLNALRSLRGLLTPGGLLFLGDLLTEDGSFHGAPGDPPAAHNGFDPEKLRELCAGLDFEVLLLRLFHLAQMYGLNVAEDLVQELPERIVAMPGAGTEVPIWLLGSSLFSAQLAAERGLPYAFASHFAPRMMLAAIDLYRRLFKPSKVLSQPYVVIGVPLIAAPSDDEAEFLASSTYQRVIGILTGDRRPLQPPIKNFMQQLHPQERAAIHDFLAAAVIGGPDKVRAGLTALAQQTQADEFMLVCDIFDPALRLQSLDIAAQALVF